MKKTIRPLLTALFALPLLASPVGAIDPSGTFSIVAYDPETEELGVAVQSRAFSVGSAVPWAEAGVGAIATQSQTNESFGPLGLGLLRHGATAEEALEALIANDPGREHRQVGIVDAHARSASFTGKECGAWAGDTTTSGLAIQGNILAGEAVVAEMMRAFQETEGELAERLIAALTAAQAAGGDRRGQQSAALLVVRPSDLYPEYRTRYIDLRVEDHKTPIDELERIFRIHQAGDLAEAHVRYAALYDSLGDESAAQRERDRVGSALQNLLDETAQDAYTLNALAWYCAMGNVYLEEALLAAKLAVQMEPADMGILDTLIEIYFRLGRHADAMREIKRGLMIAPDDPFLREQEKKIDKAGKNPKIITRNP